MFAVTVHYIPKFMENLKFCAVVYVVTSMDTYSSFKFSFTNRTCVSEIPPLSAMKGILPHIIFLKHIDWCFIHTRSDVSQFICVYVCMYVKSERETGWMRQTDGLVSQFRTSYRSPKTETLKNITKFIPYS